MAFPYYDDVLGSFVLLQLADFSRVFPETLVDSVGRIRTVSYNFLGVITKG